MKNTKEKNFLFLGNAKLVWFSVVSSQIFLASNTKYNQTSGKKKS
jgi:hypothetical protein